MAADFSEAALLVATESSMQRVRAWTKKLEEKGHRVIDGRVTAQQAIAVGAAMHMRSFGVNNNRAEMIFEQLLHTLPEGDDWLVVDRRKRTNPIMIEKAPVKLHHGGGKSLIPVIFDPASFLERLRQAS